MALELTSLTDVFQHGYDSLIDVRSPSEFAEDHVPGAINLPALTDAERARVGTIYVQDSAFKARKIGAALVARNVAAHLDGPLADKDGGWRPLVYCWRGGQRSGSVAAILSQIGWRAETIEGGYRSYRRLVVSALYEAPWPGRVVLIDGNTGTAKTDVLVGLAAAGHQVLDLEGIAHHRGSLFGGRTAPQPSQKAFETAIAQSLATLDPARPLVVEAESSKIGALLVPPGLWKAMQDAARITISAPLSARAAYLVRAYADLSADPAEARERLAALVPFQGHEQIEAWQELLDAGALEQLAAELMEKHYDPRYAKSRARKSHASGPLVQADRLDADGVAAVTDRVSALLAAM